MSSSDSDGDVQEVDLPSAAECEERCQRFAEVTGTDTALAMFFLQDRQWNLDQSLNAFFEQSGGASQSAAEAKPATAASSSADKKTEKAASDPGSKEEEKGSTKPQDPEPHRFRVLCWNIDGLSQAYLKQRTRAVIDTIKRERAEVVMLQEVVEKSEGMLREGLGADYCLLPAGSGRKEGYYSAVLLHRARVSTDDFSITPFFSSMMGRNLMTVNCCVKGVDMTVMTSHLESTASHAAERKKQLQTSWSCMKEVDPHRTVLFGGDLNLRDKELDQLGGLPSGVSDVWEMTGRRPEARYTWDTFRNDNLGSEGKWRAKHRFDRLYLRHRTTPPTPQAQSRAVKPVYFELVGLERLQGTRCFASDHWGMLAHFDILPTSDK